jgi:hypothetical protein
MSKKIQWIVLALLLLCLIGCRKTSAAIVQVTNKGAVQIHVNLSDSIMLIGPGLTGTFSFTWDGRGAATVLLLAYPVNDSSNSQTQTLELNNGDEIKVDINIPSK